ncbi:phosphate uptake regulator PhoU [Desulfurococcus mucosus]|uniref:Phosphate uptake regulator, PhoU n=1 Tax=Desulfurococcus mucosus (strain ATCC 35584 / DSM 2162 / JCM 9187 / O7/1) TaxID=765177 RepID=E8R9Z2_DESM0|nr:phosphate uptake regulator PhoU [Desulfurococcus mucosus]ADV65318.1 phosphate uptake regulator, PhoU [Desulfurococcus mucosus DSM 2162]
MAGTERRRVQKTGSSSFIITLPKEWVDSVGLKSGDYVNVEKYGDKLVIIPPSTEMTQMKASIKVSPEISVDQVFRMLLAMYLSGYNTITITFDPGTPDLAKFISDVKNTARIKLAGVEVVEESFNSVTFKILLNIKELPLISAMRRLHLIVNNMMEDVKTLLRTMDENVAYAIIQRDDEADRFHHMIVRELSMALLDVRVQHELGITNVVEALSYRIIARNLERIADHNVNIARRVLAMKKTSGSDIVYKLVVKASDLFNKAMGALYSLSRRDAEEVIQSSRALVDEIEKTIYEEIINSTLPDNEKAGLTLICDSIRRIARYSNGIAESVLNIKAAKNPSVEVK